MASDAPGTMDRRQAELYLDHFFERGSEARRTIGFVLDGLARAGVPFPGAEPLYQSSVASGAPELVKLVESQATGSHASGAEPASRDRARLERSSAIARTLGEVDGRRGARFDGARVRALAETVGRALARAPYPMFCGDWSAKTGALAKASVYFVIDGPLAPGEAAEAARAAGLCMGLGRLGPLAALVSRPELELLAIDLFPDGASALKVYLRRPFRLERLAAGPARDLARAVERLAPVEAVASVHRFDARGAEQGGRAKLELRLAEGLSAERLARLEPFVGAELVSRTARLMGDGAVHYLAVGPEGTEAYFK